MKYRAFPYVTPSVTSSEVTRFSNNGQTGVLEPSQQDVIKVMFGSNRAVKGLSWLTAVYAVSGSAIYPVFDTTAKGDAFVTPV